MLESEITQPLILGDRELYYDLLGHNGLGFTELRIKGTGLYSRMVNTKDKFLGECANADSSKAEFVFAGINPRRHPLGSGPNGGGTSNDVLYLCNIVLDCDGPAVSDEEIVKNFGSCSFMVWSGNGWHIYYSVIPVKIDDSNRQDISDRTKAFTDSKRSQFGHLFKKIDHVHDLARVMRVPGSYNLKDLTTPKLCRLVLVTDPLLRHDFKSLTDGLPISLYNGSTTACNTDLKTKFENYTRNDAQIQSLLSGCTKYDSPSEKVFVFVKLVSNYGFNLNEVKELINIYSIGTKDKDYSSDVERILEKSYEDRKFKPISLYFDSYVKSLSNNSKGFDTGYPTLNKYTGGFRRKELIILGAYTNHGKTTLSCNLAQKFLTDGLSVLMFPTEMNFRNIINKFVGMETCIQLEKLRDGNLTQIELNHIKNFQDKFKKDRLYISEEVTPTIQNVSNIIDRCKPDIVILDYIQMCSDSNTDTRARGIENFAKDMKELAKTNNFCCILTSQINEDQSLRDSKGIDHPADISLRLIPDQADFSKTDVQMVLKVVKNRYGRHGIIKLLHKSDIGIISEI